MLGMALLLPPCCAAVALMGVHATRRTIQGQTPPCFACAA